MGLFSGALKRLKNSWGNIGKNTGNTLTLAGKSGIPGLFAPMGLGSFVNTGLKKLGQSTYRTGQAILGEITGDEYFDELAEINKYGLIFGPYNTYKTFKEYGFEDGLKRVVDDNISYAKEFLPMGGKPTEYITNVANKAVDFAEEPYNAMANYVTNTYNEIRDQGIVDYTTNKINEGINETTNTLSQLVTEGPISTAYQKASEKAKQIAGYANTAKSGTNAAMSKIANYINNVNK